MASITLSEPVDKTVSIAAVVHIRLYEEDKAQLGRQEMSEWDGLYALCRRITFSRI